MACAPRASPRNRDGSPLFRRSVNPCARWCECHVIGAVAYSHGPAYGAQKAGADKVAADMAKELQPHNVAAVSIWMGGLDTERARAPIASLPREARPTARRESPQFTGRVISALYAANDFMHSSGRALIGAELGARLGVTDIDGSAPRSLRDELGGPPELHSSLW